MENRKSNLKLVLKENAIHIKLRRKQQENFAKVEVRNKPEDKKMQHKHVSIAINAHYIALRFRTPI